MFVVSGDAEMAFHEAVDGIWSCARGADECDDLVDVADGVDHAFEHVGFFLCFAEEVLRASRDDIDAVVDVQLEHFFERERSWLAVNQRDVHDRECLLQRRELVELILDDVRVCAASKLHDDAGARVASGLVADIGDFFDAFIFDGEHDAFDEG